MNNILNQNYSEKHSRFINLASKRTSNVLHSIHILQQCFDQGHYDYTPDQAKKIIGALEAKLDDLRLASERRTSRTHFSL